MLKKIIFTLVSVLPTLLFSQELVKDSIPSDSLKISNWNIIGDNSLLLSQNSFSNWIAGGNNSFGITAKTKYEFNYKKGKNIWKNKIVLGYGQVNNEKEKTKKTDDIVSLNSSYGHKISHKWYAGVAASLLTQIANGYDYGANPDYTAKDRKSAFMAPGYFTVGIGFEYRPEGKFQMSLLPITAKTTLVLDEKLQTKGNFGLKHDGDWKYMELGALTTFKYKTEIMKNIVWDNSLTLFSNYISHFERVDISYSTFFDMKINNYISSKLTFDLLYDHDQIKKLQVKQTLGVGFSYKLDNKKKE